MTSMSNLYLVVTPYKDIKRRPITWGGHAVLPLAESRPTLSPNDELAGILDATWGC
jgi:hypothetical protein